ncbi:iron chelate uptake ABC transporter family permease subunit [Actinobacillus pleuropneumoniae]|uniref:Iron(III) transport system permease protein n=5 Tax=Actinobacillus pleuropneumoniae TaxID=715 RepID=B0BNZ6_ACTPJ|nr:iron chelate uptake ABC transporter family permease subunit [Actinobacillus pleuropneumoniae]ABY69281.1 iron(III) transport system permease protein [Actinobacillus pleuropneumoniae serovar 3 str. JL03]ACE61410.1 iron(III) ABC transporter, permease protein [Actinobacillus pleuropneumoniae serovar 7 str. AP76]ASU16685.1 Iron-uptake system permease protein FeuC [Actinobacillus pleuropneumoniae]AWG95125.1 iron ABC transporter permease [Actinobacillus pleuropneumoniae serovar 1 str. 4074]AXA2119
MRTSNILFFLTGILFASSLFFMAYNANGNWDFVLPFRGKKLVLLLTIAYTIGVSTLLFQTLTNNPILTPSILGFDSLYLLIQTALVFTLGGVGFTQLDLISKFGIETSLMLFGSLLLFRTLNKNNTDLARMILVGVIFGVLFRSLNNLLQRMIDPEEFAVAQSTSFASFNTANPTLLWISVSITILSACWIWHHRHKLDILLLGKDRAIGLGLNYSQFTRQLLVCCALLVAVSTALVGPILFLGLLVCALVNAISPVIAHSVRIPMTVIISSITLVLGQAVFEQLLKMQGVLSVVIEFAGGIVFIYLILKQKK